MHTTLHHNKGTHDFLAEDLLIPHVNRCDAGRINMFTSHINQFLILNEAEVPKVFTNFENQVGIHSEGLGFVSTQHDYKFIKEIPINENYSYFLLERKDTKEIEVIVKSPCERLTESYGYLNNNAFEPPTKRNDTIEAGTIISYNNNYDEHLNYKYGVNLKAIFLAKDGLTFEDGIIISESAAKKFNHTLVHEVIITMGNNDVLVNLYGNDSVYKPFPEVNEEIHEGILASRRRINYNTVLSSFKDSMDTAEKSDTVFYFDGVVQRIEVFDNFSNNELDQPYYAPIKKIKDEQTLCYSTLVKDVDAFTKKGYTLGDNLGFHYQKAVDYLDETKFNHDKSIYDGVVLRFTITETIPIKVGSKITGRYGNKG